MSDIPSSIKELLLYLAENLPSKDDKKDNEDIEDLTVRANSSAAKVINLKIKDIIDESNGKDLLSDEIGKSITELYLDKKKMNESLESVENIEQPLTWIIPMLKVSTMLLIFLVFFYIAAGYFDRIQSLIPLFISDFGVRIIIYISTILLIFLYFGYYVTKSIQRSKKQTIRRIQRKYDASYKEELRSIPQITIHGIPKDLFDDTKSILQSDKLKLNDKLTLPKT
jgi:hypothetical protein